jgi:methionyl-tRNA formyltransferase
MKIVFFGSSNFALPILEILNTHHQVLAVVTTPDSVVGRNKELSENPVSVLAKELGLKIFKPLQVRDNDLFRLELGDLKADIFIVSAYGMLLPEAIINMPPYKTLNTHPSLLPRYRGPSPIQYAILNGDTETGTSIMVLDAKMDHGPVVTAEKYVIEADDNYITLSQKLAHASANLLYIALPDYSAGRLKPLEQNHSLATYTKIISKQDGKIDWNKKATEIYNQFRAYYPWPGIWTVWNGKIVKIIDCLPSPAQQPGLVPGTIIEGGFIACGSSTVLQINNLQLEGKTETDIQSFLNGYKGFVGSKME